MQMWSAVCVKVPKLVMETLSVLEGLISESSHTINAAEDQEGGDQVKTEIHPERNGMRCACTLLLSDMPNQHECFLIVCSSVYSRAKCLPWFVLERWSAIHRASLGE